MSAALSPLEQLEQQSSQAQPNTTAVPSQSDSNLSPLEQLEQQSAKTTQQATPSGQITNDVGNTVIVPKDGESFSDTMKRAAAQGQKTTPDQINREIATMPGKAATVVGAAPVMGAAGTAGLAGMGEMMLQSPTIAKAVLQHISEPGTVLKFPYGRAVEYLLTGRMGLSQSHLSAIAKHIP